MVAEEVELGWPSTKKIYLTIDYECDYGTALAENTYQALAYTNQLVELLEAVDVPLTCFVQTAVLEEEPEEVERLRSAGFDVTFHPHSHTHKPRDETDVPREVARSTDVFEEFFEREPVGYRFPNGNIRPEDYEALTDNGYAFDASVFPSWRPGHFDHRDAPLRPTYLSEHDLYEIPFSVYSDHLRIPTALSYCQLLGRPFTELLLRRPPATVIFNVHMHDLVNPDTYADLSPLYRAIYSRNPDGISLLGRILERFQAADYEFGHLDEVYESLAANGNERR